LLQTFAKRFNARGRTVVSENSDDLINPSAASVAVPYEADAGRRKRK
jgi:hypothetical protein